MNKYTGGRKIYEEIVVTKSVNLTPASLEHSKKNFIFFLPNSCSICTKKQNRHFIVPRDDFTLLEVVHLAKLYWKGCGGVRELWS